MAYFWFWVELRFGVLKIVGKDRSLWKTCHISCAQSFQCLRIVAELCFGGWDKGLGLAFGFGVVTRNHLLMSVQYLCAIVAHKYSMSCNIFELLSAPGIFNLG